MPKIMEVGTNKEKRAEQWNNDWVREWFISLECLNLFYPCFESILVTVFSLGDIPPVSDHRDI